jgi:hypothetical protein
MLTSTLDIQERHTVWNIPQTYLILESFQGRAYFCISVLCNTVQEDWVSLKRKDNILVDILLRVLDQIQHIHA